MKKIFIFLIALIFIFPVQGILYQGNNEICFLDMRNNETCLNSSENFVNNDSKDYIIILNNINYEKSPEKFFDNSDYNNSKFIGYSMIILAMIAGLILFFRSYLNY